MVSVIGCWLVNKSSNPERGCVHFTSSKNPWERYESKYYASGYEQIVRQIGLFNFGVSTGLGLGKL